MWEWLKKVNRAPQKWPRWLVLVGIVVTAVIYRYVEAAVVGWLK